MLMPYLCVLSGHTLRPGCAAQILLCDLQPVQGEYARFFGQSSSPGEPVLAQSRALSEQQPAHTASNIEIDAPRHRPTSAHSLSADVNSKSMRDTAEGTLGQQRADREGEQLPLPSAALHFEGCLGDVLCVHVDLISILPQAVPLQQITLVVAIMQVAHCHLPHSPDD